MSTDQKSPSEAVEITEPEAAAEVEEAAHGDRQAIAKLARLKQQAEQSAPVKEDVETLLNS